MSESPFDVNSPEWMIWQNMIDTEKAAAALFKEASQCEEAARVSRLHADRFRAPLEKLDPSVGVLLKNPYDADTPEWQLAENVITNERLVEGSMSNARRLLDDAARKEAKAAKYRAAVAKLSER